MHERLRSAEPVRHEPRAVAPAARDRLDPRDAAVHLVVDGDARQLARADADADARGGQRRRVALRPLREVRVPVVALHVERERGALHGQGGAALEERLGHAVDVVVPRVGGVDHRELDLARHLDVVERLPLLDRHLRVDLEHARHELAREQEDEPRVHDPEAELRPGELDPLHLRGDEVRGEDEPDEAAAGEDGEGPVGPRHVPPDEEAADELVDGAERAELHLGERAGDDEHHQHRQADDGELQGRDDVPDAVNDVRSLQSAGSPGGG